MVARKWTDEQREEALAAYQLSGPAEAERQTGIPRKTIASWARRYHVQGAAAGRTAAATRAAQMKWAERKARLADLAGELAENLLIRADRERIPRDQKLLVEAMEKAAGVAQLLSGNATSRTEHDVTDRQSRLAVVRDIQGAVRERQEGSGS